MNRREERKNILLENEDIIDELGLGSVLVDDYEFSNRVIEEIEQDIEETNDSGVETEIVFEKMDTISAAIKHGDDNNTGADFLVFASKYHYGGGVWNGAKAQEEDVFLCTDLQTIREKITEACYPLKGVAVVDCNIIRRGTNFSEIKPRESRAFFAAAPNLNKNGESEIDFWPRICGLVYSVARAYKSETLILGAWGCGVFKNNPKYVASLFKKVLPILKEIYPRKIVFAIPDEMMLNIFKERITNE